MGWMRWGSGADGPAVRSARRVLAVVVSVMSGGSASFVLWEAASTSSVNPLVATVVVLLSVVSVSAPWIGIHGWQVFTMVLALIILRIGQDAETFASSQSAAQLVSIVLLTLVSAMRLIAALPLAVLIYTGVTSSLWIHHLGTVASPDTALVNVSLVLAAVAFIDAVWRRAGTQDRLDHKIVAAEREQREWRLRQREADAARRVLHDDVLAALQSISEVRPGREQLVRDACKRAVEAVRVPRQRRQGGVMDGQWIDHLVLSSPVRVSLDVEPSVRDEFAAAPAVVCDAFAGAAAEALRNVSRHAGVDEAHIRFSAETNGLVLIVEDAGGAVAPGLPGFGISQSIRQRMVDAGGSGDVRLGIEGTVVTLRWPAERAASTSSEDAKRAIQHLPPTSRGTLWWIVAPLLVAQSLIAARQVPEEGWPWLQALIGLTLLGSTLGATHLLESERMTGRRWWITAAAIYAAMMASVLLAGPQSLQSFASWAIGYASVPLTALAYHGRLTWLPGLVIPGPTFLLLLAWSSTSIEVVDTLGGLSCFSYPLVGGLLGSLIRRSERRISEQRIQLASAEIEARSREFETHERDRHLRYTESAVVPWLERVIVGSVALRDDRTAHQARRLMWEVRDDLHAPEFFTSLPREDVRTYRDQGGRVDVRPGVDRAPRTAAAVHVLINEFPRRKITVTRVGDKHRIAVVPGREAVEVCAAVGACADNVASSFDDYVIQLEISETP